MTDISDVLLTYLGLKLFRLFILLYFTFKSTSILCLQYLLQSRTGATLVHHSSRSQILQTLMGDRRLMTRACSSCKITIIQGGSGYSTSNKEDVSPQPPSPTPPVSIHSCPYLLDGGMEGRSRRTRSARVRCVCTCKRMYN